MPSWILAKGPSDYILLTIRITVRIQESEVRNRDSLDSGVQRRFALSEHQLSLITHIVVINVRKKIKKTLKNAFLS